MENMICNDIPITKNVYDGKFINLRTIETDNYKYEYMHESRCEGHIVSIMPVHINGNMIVRNEFTPAWSAYGNHISSITGGWEREKHETPFHTAIEELREEAGIVLKDNSHITSLGVVRGSKASDTVYHLFMVKLTDDNFTQVDIEGDGSFLESKAENLWAPCPTPSDPSWLGIGADPLLYVSYLRWTCGIEIPVNLEDYKNL